MAKNEINKDGVSSAVINRLPRYYRFLRELYCKDILRISSGELAKIMGVTASQIRHDLNCFGGFGQQGYGYNVVYLYKKIGEILGVQDNFSAVIVGAGNLGRAISSGTMFTHRGVKLTAVFDNDPNKYGAMIGGCRVMPMELFAGYCREKKIDIAVLTVPQDAARDVAALACEAGVSGIWNYTNVDLGIQDSGVTVQDVYLGDTLMTLCYTIKEKKNEK